MTTRRLSSTLLIAILATIGFLFLLPDRTMAQVEEEVLVAPVQELVAKGRISWRLYCSSCHGESGKGDGPMAEQLRPAPADLTLLSQKNRGEFPAEKVLRIIDGRNEVQGHGSKDMPAWGKAFQVVEEAEAQTMIGALTHFIWSIQAGEGFPVASAHRTVSVISVSPCRNR